VLEERFPETVETQPELLAHHYTEAGFTEQAVSYWERAGKYARERSAHAETIGHLTQGIALLSTLPETTERHRQELAMQTTLGLAFLASKGQGVAEVDRTLNRARELCLHVEDATQLFRVLLGLRRYYFSHAELRTTHALDEQLLHLAQQTQDPAQLLEAHRVQGSTLYCLGNFTASLEHLESGLALYNRDQHRTRTLLHGIDPGTMCLSWASLVLWTLGYPDQARERIQAALTLAQDLSHAYSVASVHYFAARFHQLCQEPQAVRERAEAAIALSTEQEFPYWLALGTTLLGWALAVERDRREGLAYMCQAFDSPQLIGGELNAVHSLVMQSDAEQKNEQSAFRLRCIGNYTSVTLL
jgi:tetratricopeptide (TPR) repeat protein